MPTVVVTDFKAGLDARNMNETTLPGALLRAQNAVINRGGEIEKLPAWKIIFFLPNGTFGMKVVDDVPHVFGSIVEPVGIPQGVTYDRLNPASGAAMTAILSTDLFDGKIYAIAQFDDGNIVHFYDGVEVTGLVDGTASANFELISGSGGTVDTVKVDGIELLSGAVAFNSSLSQTATDVAADITANATAPNYTAVADNQRVIVNTVTTGLANNGKILTVTSTTINVTIGQSVFAGGLDTGAGLNPGRYVKTINSKEYLLSGSILGFSNIDKPTEFNPDEGTGAGFINLSNHSSGSENLLAIAEFFQHYAVFGDHTIQIWALDPDEELNAKQQTIRNSGTLAAKSVQAFGNDTVYLDRSGVRSLRGRDSSRSANVNDIGTAIDPLIQPLILTDRTDVINASAIVDPLDGRYFLVIGGTVYIFSFFPGGKISAWTTAIPGFDIEDFDQRELNVLARSGNNIYQLGGGTSGGLSTCPLSERYEDAQQADIILPFLDAGDPSRFKMPKGIDVACEGEWDVYVLPDPQDITVQRKIATISDSTFRKGRISLSDHGTHFALRFVSRNNGPSKIGRVLFHFARGMQE